MKAGKFTVGAVCVGALLATAACGSDSGGSGGSGGSDFKAAFVVGQKGPAFYTNMLCGAGAEAKKIGIKLSSSGAPDWGPAQQIPLINAALAGQPKVLVVVPTDPTALDPVLKQASASGTKIITADTVLKNKDVASALVTSDNKLAGKQGADQLAKLMGEKGTAVVISNPPGISTTADRRSGFLDEMKSKYPSIKLLPVQYNDTTAQKSASLVNAVLAAHPELSGIYGTDDVGSIGAGTALRNANLTDKINVVGTDADPGLVGQLKSGELDALVTQRPDIQGQQAMEFAEKLAKGETVPKETYVPTVVVTRENLNGSEAQASIYKDSCS
jgi:ABC-type sugar transport system substrate-binding protein